MRFTAFVLLAVGFACAAALRILQEGLEIVIGDGSTQPESLAVAPSGALITGSASSPFIYRVRKGSTTAEKFIDASKEPAGTIFFGVLADAASKTLWACQVTELPGTKPVKRHSILRSFDLEKGTPKVRWTFPEDNNMCNDFSVGPDKALYIADTMNSRIYRLAPGASKAELFLEDRALYGIDGITFLNGVLYVDNVFSNNLYRIPIDAAGKPGQPVDIWMDQPIKGPDGMRAANGKLIMAENYGGKIAVVTVNGDKASVTEIKDGLKTPAAVEPAGDVIWIAERGTGKAISIPMPKH